MQTDEQLMERVTHGDTEALAELMGRHEDGVKRLVLKYVECQHICDDVSQEIWSDVSNGRAKYAEFQISHAKPFIPFLISCTTGKAVAKFVELRAEKRKGVAVIV